MKNLILVRHAKSSWETPLTDYDRPLTNRGISDAHVVSQNAVAFLPSSFTVITSTSRRAMSTALIFAQNFSYPIDSIKSDDDLYTFESQNLEKIVRHLDNDLESVILFGHNAAITNFVNKFGNIFIENVTTAGLVSLKFQTNHWRDISKGQTVKVLFPRDLKNDHR